MDIREGVEAVQERAEKGLGRLRDRLGDANENLESFSDQASERAQNALKETVTWIKKHPGAAVGIAVISGVVIGAMTIAWAKD